MAKPDAKELAKKISKLNALAREKGYFNVPLWEQMLRCVEVFAAPALALFLLTQGGLAAVAGALVLAVHFPRTAYLGHDVAHNQWGPRNDAKPRFMLGVTALAQGFGSAWWVEKHELHHAFPNGCRVNADGVLVPIDGDIDTAPWLVWDKALAEFNTRAPKTLMDKIVALVMPRFQVFLFFPLLAMSRFNWSFQSVQTALRQKDYVEAGLCVAHWVVSFTLVGLLTPGPAWTGWLWLLCAQLLGGFILGFVFVLNHTGMEIYDASEAGGFYDRQARSTRNTPSSLFFDWLTGGLNSQIEHHMFPTMARRNLPKMREATKDAMEECGYDYEVLGNRDAIRAVIGTLSTAAKA